MDQVDHAETPVCACLSRSRRRQVPRTGRQRAQRKPPICGGSAGPRSLAGRDPLPPAGPVASEDLTAPCGLCASAREMFGLNRILHMAKSLLQYQKTRPWVSSPIAAAVREDEQPSAPRLGVDHACADRVKGFLEEFAAGLRDSTGSLNLKSAIRNRSRR